MRLASWATLALRWSSTGFQPSLAAAGCWLQQMHNTRASQAEATGLQATGGYHNYAKVVDHQNLRPALSQSARLRYEALQRPTGEVDLAALVASPLPFFLLFLSHGDSNKTCTLPCVATHVLLVRCLRAMKQNLTQLSPLLGRHWKLFHDSGPGEGDKNRRHSLAMQFA